MIEQLRLSDARDWRLSKTLSKTATVAQLCAIAILLLSCSGRMSVDVTNNDNVSLSVEMTLKPGGQTWKRTVPPGKTYEADFVPNVDATLLVRVYLEGKLAVDGDAGYVTGRAPGDSHIAITLNRREVIVR